MIILGSLVVTVGISCGSRKTIPGMPLAGSCSAVISAACHPPATDENPSIKPVMWGVVSKEDHVLSDDDVGHCSFTSLQVEPPTVGRIYAGHDYRQRKFAGKYQAECNDQLDS